MAKLLIASVPRSGLRWLRDSLGGFHNVPWLTAKNDLHIHMQDNNRVCGHHPPFENVLALPHIKVYLRRKDPRDQITSFANHPHAMISPSYIEMHMPYTDINNAIRTMAQVYEYMDQWYEYADHIIYYEDLCEDFEKAVGPMCVAIGESAHDLAAYSKTQDRYKRKGCPGIGQYKAVWTDENYELYKELFGKG
jgi:hypothetical protein